MAKTILALLALVACTKFAHASCGCNAARTTTTTTAPTTTSTSSSVCNEALCEACPTCPMYNLVNNSLDQSIQTSPWFVVLADTSSPLFQYYNSRCYTFLVLNNSTSLFFLTTTNTDGSYYIQLYFIKPGPQDGSFTLVGLGGPNADGGEIAVVYAVGEVCSGCSKTTCLNIKVLAQDCNQQSEYLNDNVAFASTLNGEQCCFDQAVPILESYAGQGNIGPLPNSAPVFCVASFGGNPVVRASTLSEDSRIVPLEYINTP